MEMNWYVVKEIKEFYVSQCESPTKLNLTVNIIIHVSIYIYTLFKHVSCPIIHRFLKHLADLADKYLVH